MSRVTQDAMRGPSAWSVGDRELMAALIAKTNECEWCTKAHTAVAERAYGDAAMVSAVLANLETAPIEEPLRATLRMIRKLSREHSVDGTTCERCWLPVSRESRSKTHSPSASRSTR
jgi:AhpD family alkylhydroperoxidase